MTAVDWLIEQIKNDQNHKALTGLEWMKVIKQAKDLEMQQMEISDEYIDERAESHSKTSSNKTIAKTYFKHGARWYREHLKQRQ